MTGDIATAGPFALGQAAPLGMLGTVGVAGSLAYDAPFTLGAAVAGGGFRRLGVQGALLLNGAFVLSIAAPVSVQGAIGAVAVFDGLGSGDNPTDPKFQRPSHNTRIRWQRKAKQHEGGESEAQAPEAAATEAAPAASPKTPPRSTGVGKVAPPPAAATVPTQAPTPRWLLRLQLLPCLRQRLPPGAGCRAGPAPAPAATEKALAQLEQEMQAYVEGAVVGLTKQIAALEKQLQASTDELAAARREIADLRRREINRQRAEELHARRIAEEE